MSDTTAANDIGAIAALAEAAVGITVVDREDDQFVVLPAGATGAVIRRDETFDSGPRWVRGNARLDSGGDFARYVSSYAVDHQTAVYADLLSRTIVGVLDGNRRETGYASGVAAWGAHRATYRPVLTEPWVHWTGRDGVMLSHESFAEHMEDGAGEVVVPDAADLMSAVAEFHVTSKAEFRSAVKVSGGRQFSYEADDTGRSAGNVVLPDRITLGLRPFEEGDRAYRIDARIKWQLRGKELLLGYKLDRPRVLLDEAFGDVLAVVTEGMPETIPLLRGVPPIEASPSTGAAVFDSTVSDL